MPAHRHLCSRLAAAIVLDCGGAPLIRLLMIPEVDLPGSPSGLLPPIADSACGPSGADHHRLAHPRFIRRHGPVAPFPPAFLDY